MAEAPTTEAPAFPLDIKAGDAPAAPPTSLEGVGHLYPEGGKDAAPSAPAAPVPAPEAAPAAPPAAAPPAAEPVLAAGAEGGEAPAAKEGESPAAPALTPDSYTLTLPEGFIVADAVMSEAKTLLADAGVDPAKAQGLVSILAKVEAARADAAAATMTSWLTASNALPEFQGEMRKTSLATIGRAFDEYGSAEVQEVFAQTGVGNHPAVVKMFLKMAAALDEGGPTRSGLPANPGPNGRPARGSTPGQILYGDSNASNPN